MKRKIIAIICILALLVCGKQAFNYFYNESVIDKYNNEEYSVSLDALTFLNIFQPYIVHYNEGNIKYQNSDYEGAIESYNKALELDPPKDEECSIRINLALAMVYKLGEAYAEPENVENSIAVLKDAKAVLLAEGCATEEGDGHSETAEELKEEIEKMLEELEKDPENKKDPDDNNEPDEKDPEDDKNDVNQYDIKQKLQEIQNESYKEREQGMKFNEEIEMEYNFDYEGSIW